MLKRCHSSTKRICMSNLRVAEKDQRLEKGSPDLHSESKFPPLEPYFHFLSFSRFLLVILTSKVLIIANKI
uniref:Uncharacterized protein n=1 Tax=Manihot esculenta TaxID=3983 RepID=A0A199UC26_MANES